MHHGETSPVARDGLEVGEDRDARVPGSVREAVHADVETRLVEGDLGAGGPVSSAEIDMVPAFRQLDRNQHGLRREVADRLVVDGDLDPLVDSRDEQHV